MIAEKGNNRIGDGNNFHDKTTQADLAEKLKVSQRQLNNYKKLLDLVPELQSAVESGQISATNAGSMRFFLLVCHKNKLPKSH